MLKVISIYDWAKVGKKDNDIIVYLNVEDKDITVLNAYRSINSSKYEEVEVDNDYVINVLSILPRGLEHIYELRSDQIMINFTGIDKGGTIGGIISLPIQLSGDIEEDHYGIRRTIVLATMKALTGNNKN